MILLTTREEFTLQSVHKGCIWLLIHSYCYYGDLCMSCCYWFVSGVFSTRAEYCSIFTGLFENSHYIKHSQLLITTSQHSTNLQQQLWPFLATSDFNTARYVVPENDRFHLPKQPKHVNRSKGNYVRDRTTLDNFGGGRRAWYGAYTWKKSQSFASLLLLISSSHPQVAYFKRSMHQRLCRSLLSSVNLLKTEVWAR